MVLNVTVKNTFIDVPDADEDEDLPLMIPVKTCPAVVYLPRMPSKLSDATLSPRLSEACGDDGEEEAEGLPPSTPSGLSQPYQWTTSQAAEEPVRIEELPASVGVRALPVMPMPTPVGLLHYVSSAQPASWEQPVTTSGSLPRQAMNVSLSSLVEVEDDRAASAKAEIVPWQDRRPEWSRGALLHRAGMCKPCGWFWKPQGCKSGQDCCHCHLCPSGTLKARRKGRSAMRCDAPG
jgi:hypothetical protein